MGRAWLGVGLVGVLAYGCALVDWATPVVGDGGPANDSPVTDAPPTDGGTGWTCNTITSDPDIHQTLPAAVATDLPPVGTVVTVAATDNLQSKINAAHGGDTLELPAGATFTGPFKLPAFNGAGWIVIRTAGFDAAAPPGTRVSPALAPQMAKLTAPSTVITMANGAGSYRLVGLEIAAAGGGTVDLTTASGVQGVILDRVYAHGGGIGLTGSGIAIVDSYSSGTAANGWAVNVLGGGPMTLRNNTFDSALGHVWVQNGTGLQFCQNLMMRDASADGGALEADFQITNGSNVLIGGNVLETGGGALQITNANVSNVTVAYNVTKLIGTFVYFQGSTSNMVVHDNLFDSTANTGTDNIRVFAGGSNVKFDHNTFTTGVAAFLGLSGANGFASNLILTNNLSPYGAYGVIGSGGDAGGMGTVALMEYATTWKFSKNGLWGSPSSAGSYPPGNYFPTNEQAVGFAPDWSLMPTSMYKGVGTDGKDLGADIATIAAATAGVGP